MEKTELAMAVTTLEFLLVNASKDDALPQADTLWNFIVDKALALATGRPFMTEGLNLLKQHATSIYSSDNEEKRAHLLRTIRLLRLRADEAPSNVENIAQLDSSSWGENRLSGIVAAA